MIYLTNRDGGLTDEEGHYKYLAAAFTGHVLSGLNVTQNDPLGMSVLVNAGDARIPYGSYAYAAWIPSGSPETATISTADGSNPRIDRIVLYVDRNEGTQQVTPNNPGIVKVAVVAGTPGAVPVRPSDSDVNSAVSNNPWINLADVAVGTGVTQITNTNITDTRTMAGPIIPNLHITTAMLGTNVVETGKIANGAVTPAKRSGGFYSGIIPAATLSSTGNKSITGVGFTPKLVEFEVLEASSPTNSSYSSGSMTVSTQYANTTAVNISGTTVTMARNSSTTACIYRVNASNVNTLRAVYVSMDVDGFTIEVTTAGSFEVAFKAYA